MFEIQFGVWLNNRAGVLKVSSVWLWAQSSLVTHLCCAWSYQRALKYFCKIIWFPIFSLSVQMHLIISNFVSNLCHSSGCELQSLTYETHTTYISQVDNFLCFSSYQGARLKDGTTINLISVIWWLQVLISLLGLWPYSANHLCF